MSEAGERAQPAGKGKRTVARWGRSVRANSALASSCEPGNNEMRTTEIPNENDDPRTRKSRPTHRRRQSSWSIAPVLTSNPRSEEHTSELQSQSNLVCRLLLEK